MDGWRCLVVVCGMPDIPHSLRCLGPLLDFTSHVVLEAAVAVKLTVRNLKTCEWGVEEGCQSDVSQRQKQNLSRVKGHGKSL